MAIGALQVRKLLRSLVASVCVVMSGCTVVPRVDLHNHSGTPVRVFVGDEVYSLAVAATQSFDYPSPHWGEIRMCMDGKLLRYTVPFPPNDYYHGIAFLFLRSHIRVQLEPDARLRILKRGEDFPVPENGDQPGPFPLSPEEVGEC